MCLQVTEMKYNPGMKKILFVHEICPKVKWVDEI